MGEAGRLRAQRSHAHVAASILYRRLAIDSPHLAIPLSLPIESHLPSEPFKIYMFNVVISMQIEIIVFDSLPR